eukprot:CAMPEP_0168368482 /NCGR_PEP_ID=MMETSP0228-20121227/6273_1 /TAXON_ID=133427 /ORGANISM="Protoceratium reticulatum, Strain CCCM 535 (=CCMP 1889)" /LENGTH=667 /DNA_ID=CAMNT_0008381329 /DNA_START=27 /DNA_END=2027 /DNA_ORIENTATION=-
MAADAPAVRRLCRDLERFQSQGNPQIEIRPSSNSMLEWHFLLHNLPEDTVYKDGVYHGKLSFPERYPFAPPSLVMLTPSGRLETNQRLCLSMTDFHPESWNPAWTVESILVGLISFMIDERDPVSFGVLKDSAEARRHFALSSKTFNLSNPDFCEMFPELAADARAATDPAEPVGGRASIVVAAMAGDSPRTRRAAPDGDGSAPQQVSAWAQETGRATAQAPAQEPQEQKTAVLPDGAQADVDGHAAAPAPGPPGDAHVANTDTRHTSDHEGSDSAREECWICREDASDEPLINPCACRGSMSGVHASCVEAWIGHHRQNAAGDEAPKCSVCGQPYSGSERRPGVAAFARHLCDDFARQAVRSGLLVALLIAYWTAAQPGLVPVMVRILLFVLSGTQFLYKATVLSVSLPRGRLPPDNFLRVCFTGDFKLVAVHIAETMAVLAIAGLWCIYGQLQYYFVLPLSLLVVMPLLSLLLRQRSSPCSSRNFTTAAFVLASPFLLVAYVVKTLWQNPQRLADPFDGLVHVVVPLAVLPLCWFCVNSIPVVMLWAVHCLVLLLGLVERGFVHRAKWKDGRIWWIFMQLSVLATYVANLLHNFSEGFLKDDPSYLVFGMSCTWLFLCCSISLWVNWGLCVEQFRTWQNRNGSFTIGPAASPAAPQTIGRAGDAA